MARGARHPRRPPTLILVALLTISVVLLVLLALGAFSLPAISKDGRVAEVRRSVREARDELQETGEQWTEVLSWEPRAFLYHNFLVFILDLTACLDISCAELCQRIVQRIHSLCEIFEFMNKSFHLELGNIYIGLSVQS